MPESRILEPKYRAQERSKGRQPRAIERDRAGPRLKFILPMFRIAVIGVLNILVLNDDGRTTAKKFQATERSWRTSSKVVGEQQVGDL